MTSEIVFQTINLRKEFGALVAVDDVNMSVRTNSLHAIIGPNGAGKTTFFNLLSGNIEPTNGQVIFKGRDITHQPVHRTIHFGIGRSFQITNIFPSLTVSKISAWQRKPWARITLNSGRRPRPSSSTKLGRGK